jgi:pyruvate,water dikinase
MVDSANGRIFYRISNWYNLILLLPFSKKVIPIWQEMMGVENKQITSNKNKSINWFVKLNVSFNIFNMLISTPKRMEKLNVYFEQIPEYFNNKYSEDLTSKELINLFEDLKNRLVTNWDITLINDLYSFIFTGLLKNKLKKMKIHNYDFIANKYISNLSNLESMKPIKELVSIAIYAKENNLYDELRELKTDERTKNYLNSNKEFAKRFNKYINNYGDRNVEELKLESKTYRTNPNLLINRICEYVKDSNLYDMIEENEIIDDALIENSKLEFYKKRASLGIRNREKSRLNRSIIYGMIRQIFLSIGKNFVTDERILSQSDIFYLSYEDILEGIKDNSYNLKRIIVKRKREYRRYKALPEYTRLVFNDKIINKQPLNIKIDETDFDEHILMGIPCSTGIVEGEVVVIDDPKNYKNIKDKILVTKMTDPGWVFLLL